VIAATPPSGAEAFGGEVQERQITVAEFMPALDSYTYATNYGHELTPLAGGLQVWIAPLGLPAGAVLEEIRLLVGDQDDSVNVVGRLIIITQAVAGTGDCDGYYSLGQWQGSSLGLDGRGIIVMAAPAPYTVLTRAAFPCPSENYIQHILEVELDSTSHNFSGAIVRWRRAVSTAPAAASFTDVPTNHPFFQFVEALAASGITAGCGGGNFCPNSPVTRGQMAVFLAKALGLHWPL
jgi:hypothetical protein